MKKFLAAIALFVLPVLFMAGRAQAFESFVINGTTYSFPDVDDAAWGQNVTDWAQAITNNVIYKVGGNFFLTNELVFGSTWGARIAYVASTGTLPNASTGFIRMQSGSSVAWRNEENTADLFLVLGASNTLWFNGAQLSTAPVGSGAVASASGQTIYDVILGTTNALNVTIGNSNTSGLVAALAVCGSAGLIQGSTASCNIFMRPGNYFLSDATIPANVNLYAVQGSSVVIISTNTTKTIMSIYGTVDGLTFDFGGTAFTSRQIEVKTGGKLLRTRIRGWTAQSALAAGTCGVCVTDSSKTLISDMFIEGLNIVPGVAVVGDNGAFQFARSSDSIMEKVVIATITNPAGSNNAGPIISFYTGNGQFTMRDCNFQGFGPQGLVLQGANKNIVIDRNYFHVTMGHGAGSAQGTISTWITNGLAISSYVVISNNQFDWDTDQAVEAIELNNNGGAGAIYGTTGLKIYNNTLTVRPTRAGGGTFAAVDGAQVEGAIFHGNMVDGCTFISDSGKNTRYTTNDNFAGDTEQ